MPIGGVLKDAVSHCFASTKLRQPTVPAAALTFASLDSVLGINDEFSPSTDSCSCVGFCECKDIYESELKQYIDGGSDLNAT